MESTTPVGTGKRTGRCTLSEVPKHSTVGLEILKGRLR